MHIGEKPYKVIVGGVGGRGEFGRVCVIDQLDLKVFSSIVILTYIKVFFQNHILVLKRTSNC